MSNATAGVTTRHARLGDIFDLADVFAKNGFPQGRHNETGEGVPHLRPFNISEDGTIDLSQIKYVAPPSLESDCWLKPGDVIFNNTNSEELVGKTAYFIGDGRFALSNHMTLLRVRNKTALDPCWLAYCLCFLWKSGVSRGICRRHVNQASISLSRMREVTVLFPHPAEQRAIVRALRAVQEAKEARERELALERERKAALMEFLFTHGTRGEPTKMTEIGEIPESWRVAKLGTIVDVKGGKRLPKGAAFAERNTNFPYIRVVDFKDGSVRTGELKYLEPETQRPIDRYIIRKEDVYISIAGTIGLVGTIPEELDGANLTENAARLVIRDRQASSNRFLASFLNSERGQSQISNLTAKTTQPKLALTRIEQIMVPVPSIEEQRAISDVFRAWDSKILALEKESQHIGELFCALLEELMSGKLSAVPLIEQEAAS
jgi:type I restriction enzyme S subunit